FKRARLASFTSVFSLFIAVLLLGVLARVSYNAYTVAQSLKKSIDIEVFLIDLDERTTRELQAKLSGQPLVQEIHYISKDSAAAIFEKEFGLGGSSLAELRFLPASFRLKVNSEAPIETVSTFVKEIKNFRGVDDIRFNRQLLQLLQSRFNAVA